VTKPVLGLLLGGVLGVFDGLSALSLALAFCVSLAQKMSGQPAYYWQIMLPGGILGVIVGYATFSHGKTAH